MSRAEPVEPRQSVAWIVALVAACLAGPVLVIYSAATVLSWVSGGVTPVAARWIDVGLALAWGLASAAAAFGSRRASRAGNSVQAWVFAAISILGIVWMFWPQSLGGMRAY